MPICGMQYEELVSVSVKTSMNSGWSQSGVKRVKLYIIRVNNGIKMLE